MKKYILNICAFTALLFLASCQKDNEQFIPNASENINGNDIFGLVIDASNNAVEGATVQFDGQTVLTDQYGTYQFKDVTLNSRHNFLNITKSGYFEGARTFRTNKKTTIQHTTQLLRKNFNRNFDGDAGGTVEQGSIKIDFPASATMIESSGVAYEGEVQVAIQYLDPTNQNIIRRAPGDMSAVDAEEIYSTLNSFGMAYVELQSADGEKLQLKDGVKATMTGQIPAKLAADAPASIKMWVFDDNSGLWEEEGSAQKVGNTYVGEVAHFSCWNYDGSAPTIIACGRVVDPKGNPLAGVHVWIATQDFFAVGHGNTNPDGTFCGAVTKDELLTLEIWSFQGCDEPIDLGTIGPFSEDVDLGDIVIEVSEDEQANVFGTAVNCDGEPVENGMLVFDGQGFQITDGTFDASIIRCIVNQEYQIRVIDLDAFVESEVIIVSGAGPHELGEVSACGEEIFRIEMNIDALGINEIGLIELYAASTDSIDVTTKTIGGFSDVDNQQKGASIRMNYDDGIDMSFGTGQFDLTSLWFNYWEANTEDSFSLLNGTITISSYNEAESFVRGNYEAEVISQQDGNTYTIYGSFKVNTF